MLGASQASKPISQALLGTSIAAAILLQARPSLADGWRPRRHLVNLQDPSVARTDIATEQPATRSTTAQAQASSWTGSAANLSEGLSRAWHRVASPNASRGYVVSGPRPSPYQSGYQPSFNWLGWTALGAAALVALGIKFQDRLGWIGRGGRRQHGGRWVRDRSLGGKMVFIPDPESTLPAAKRPLWDFEDGVGSSAAPSTSSIPSGRSKETASAPPAPPSWWVEHDGRTGGAQLPATQRAELETEACQLLRRLEDDKVLQGEDYSLEGLGRLATLNQEAGPDLVVHPATANGRDAMLRRGVQAALEAAMAARDGAASLVGPLPLPPAPFVCRLAAALGVPAERTAAMVRAELAAAARAEIIGAEAGARRGDAGGVSRAARRLARGLAAFPLPRASAEAELVAGSVRTSAGLEVRRRLFVEAGADAGAGSGDTTHVLAELLGFDPELVVPQHPG
ncbi:hypothetical protein ACKKBG_A32825 [Auxenochlorella protothecoides x Auxenochlorella symbiontica]